MKGIEIGRSMSGEFTLWLLSPKSFPGHLFNLDTQTLGTRDLENLEHSSKYRAISLREAPLQKYLGKAMLGDLLAAKEFFHHCMPEIKEKITKEVTNKIYCPFFSGMISFNFIF